MEYHQLGSSGLRVSPLCLGTMGFGGQIDEDTAGQMLNEALDLGVNFIDTADVYGRGTAEDYVGKALAESGRRDEVVLGTKAVWKMGSGPNDWGASRYHLVRAVEASLRRLQTDRIDLFYLHVVDPTTPLGEILDTLQMLVKQGKILYIGTSKWPVSLVVEMLVLARQTNKPRIVAEQPPYAILDRSIENELAWAALRHGVGLCTFGPLMEGILSGKYKKDGPPPAVGRRKNAGSDDRLLTPQALDVVEQLRPLVAEQDCTMAEYALAWVMQQPFITSAVVGCRTLPQLRSAVKACQVEISAEELAKIDQIVPPGTAVSDYYDYTVVKHARVAALAGNWRAYPLIDRSPPPGQDRRSIH